MDDSAHRKPPTPTRQSLEPRVSAVKSIVQPRQRGVSGPTMPQILESLNQASRETRGFATDEKTLRAYVHALERLYPTTRFAMRLSPRTAEDAAIVQATTHHVRPEAAQEVAITEAGLLRAGLPQPASEPPGMRLRRTYEPILVAGPNDPEFPADGLDVPLSIAGEVIGVLAAELERGMPLPPRLEDALLMTASQASAAIESGRLRREALHLRDYLEKLLEHANIPVLVVGRDRNIAINLPQRMCCSWPARVTAPGFFLRSSMRSEAAKCPRSSCASPRPEVVTHDSSSPSLPFSIPKDGSLA